jgi:hypothetical protein
MTPRAAKQQAGCGLPPQEAVRIGQHVLFVANVMRVDAKNALSLAIRVMSSLT